MSAFRKQTIEIKYDGTKEDLVKNVEIITTALGNFSLYKDDIANINEYILEDIDYYITFKWIYIGSLILINTKIGGFKTLFWKSPVPDVSINPYPDFFMTILYVLIFLFLIIFIVVCCYCFINDVQVVNYLIDDFGQIF